MRRTVLSTLLGAALAASLAVVPISAAVAAPQPNDSFANAGPFPYEGGTYVGTNVDATAEPAEPNHAHSEFGEAFHSIWYRWTAANSGQAKISTCGSQFNTRIGVYTGSAVNALTEVAYNEDGNDPTCSSPKFAVVTFAAKEGTTYSIAVDTSGGVPDDANGAPQGDVKITVTPPTGDEEPPPPPPDEDTNPGTAASEPSYSFTMPRVKVYCDEFGDDSPNDCLSNKSKGLRFWSVEKHQSWTDRLGAVRTWLTKQRAKGADITFIPRPIAANDLPRPIRDHLRGPKGRGGEVIYQSITPGERITTTADQPARLVVQYFEPAEDRKVLEAELARLQKAGEDRKNVKSPCDFIDSDASFDDIEVRLGEALGSGLSSEKRAGEILKQFGCGYEVKEYLDAPGLTVDTVLDVVGVDKKRNVIQLKVGLPRTQDLALVISEEPEFATPEILGLGLDGKLTASATQLNRITVQVIERTTGRLVPGVELEFFDDQGNPKMETTNPMGEWTFTSRLPRADDFALLATYRGANGATMMGYRRIEVVDRKASYVTMAGRTMTWNGSSYAGTTDDVVTAKQLEIVPGILGTGIAGAPTAPPQVRQIQVAKPSGSSFVAGQHNAVHLPNDTNYLVGSASGLVTIGGGYSNQVGSKPVVARAWPNPFQQAANWLAGVLTGIQKAFESGEGTVTEKTSAADKQKVSASQSALVNNGAQPAGSGLISDKGLGLIGQAGGNLIGQAGGNVIATGGLNLIGQAGGNLIGQAGGNLISDKGLGRPAHHKAGTGISIGQANVISLEKDMMPVYGGNVIATQ